MSNRNRQTKWRHRRISIRLLLLNICILALAAQTLLACAPRKAVHPKNGKVLVGFSMDSLVVERWKRDLEIFSRSLEDLGAGLIVKIADQDPDVQIAQVKELIASGIDVLVIIPNDADKLSAVVREAKAAGIPVLSYDRLVRKAGATLYISYDNEKVGSLMAEAMCKSVPEGNYVILNGPRIDNNAAMINAGIHKILDSKIAAGELKIAAEIWPSTWDSEEARRAMEQVVLRNKPINAVLCGNDMLAEAAIQVLTENRLIDTVKVSGQDAELAACQRIAEGSQFITVYKPIDALALKAAGFAVMLARGESAQTSATVDDGLGKIPFVRLDPMLVTRELLESTVIRDGFHEKDDIYRNVVR